MESVYWGCLIGGSLFAIISVVLGDIIGSFVDGLLDFFAVDFLKPIITASAVTSFGGAGILLGRYSALGTTAVLIFSIVIAIFLCIAIYFLYVKPMENSENSTSYSITELPGMMGEVTVPIPEKGFGEIMVNFVAGNTLHIASSWDKRQIPVGTKVVVVDTEDGVVKVSELYSEAT